MLGICPRGNFSKRDLKMTYIFWSEIGSGSGEPIYTRPPKIPSRPLTHPHPHVVENREIERLLRRRQRERHKTIGFNIEENKGPYSAKQQCEMTKFKSLWATRAHEGGFFILSFNLNAVSTCLPRSRYLSRHATLLPTNGC